LLDLIFAPPLAETVELWVAGNSFDLPDWQKPNHRLAWISDIVSTRPAELRAEQQKSIRESAAELAVDWDRYWDSEEWWEQTTPTIAGELERIICDEVFSGLKSESDRAFPTVGANDWKSEVERCILACKKILPSIRGPIAMTESIGEAILRPTANVVKSRVILPKAIEDVGELMDPRDIFVGAPGKTIMVRAQNVMSQDSVARDTESWLKCSISHESNTLVVYRVAKETLAKALLGIKHVALLGMPVPEIWPLVTPYNGQDIRRFAELHNELVSMLTQNLTAVISILGRRVYSGIC
jgi:hypothetical protein